MPVFRRLEYRGIEETAAPLLAFIDPDDFLNEIYFSELISAMRRIDADIAISAENIVTESGNPDPYILVNKIGSYAINRYANSALLNNQDIINALCNDLFTASAWGKLFKRDFWGDAHFPIDTDIGEDVETILGVVVRANRAICAPQAVYYYRQRRKSLSHGNIDYQRLQKNLKASSVMLDQLCLASPESERSFQWLKFQCDVDVLGEYVRSNSEVARGRSKLKTLSQAIEDSGTYDILRKILKKLVEL